MKIAIEGCCHGELDTIYATIQHMEQTENIKLDLLLICGDFQSIRNLGDADCMACPPKYRKVGDFYKYYSGEKKAPVPTLFIGGNHEASNYLLELFHGGWVAENIYFLGFANVVKFRGVRIAGLSGIYKSHDYNKDRYEKPPYSEGDLRSIYHIRKKEVGQLSKIKEPVDIFLSHDWPTGVTKFGDLKGLLRRKPFLTEEIEMNTLGNPKGEYLLKKIKPTFWFSAHMHVKFAAKIPHTNSNTNSEESTKLSTKFLALDKCLPRRHFLQVIDIPDCEGEDPTPFFCYDREWISILRATSRREENDIDLLVEEERKWVDETFQSEESLRIPNNFCITQSPYNPTLSLSEEDRRNQRVPAKNPQMEEFFTKFQLALEF